MDIFCLFVYGILYPFYLCIMAYDVFYFSAYTLLKSLIHWQSRENVMWAIVLYFRSSIWGQPTHSLQDQLYFHRALVELKQINIPVEHKQIIHFTIYFLL